MTFSIKDKHILITGATGFIGGAVARQLLRDGCQLRALARTPGKAASLRALGAEIMQGDLGDLQSLEKAMQGIEIVIHVAGAINIAADVETYRAMNASGIDNICKAAANAGVARFYYTSSVLVYGTAPGENLDDNAPHRISGDAYTDTKIDGEHIVREWLAKGLPVVILQPTQTYGPEDNTWTLHPFDLTRRNLMILPDGGRGIIQPIFIDDLIAGYMAAFEQGEVGETYILEGAEPVEIRTFFGHYAKMLGKRWIPGVPALLASMGAAMIEGLAKLAGVSPIFTRDNVRGITRQISYSGKKAEQALHFVPTISLETGMAKVEAWLQETGCLS